MDNDSVSFSIYGYLDATADTQWVRVAPVRKLLASPVEKPEMMVSLEHLSSGDKVVMSDTLLKFQFPTGKRKCRNLIPPDFCCPGWP